MNYITKVELISRNGRNWFYQEFDRYDGQLEAVNLYDENGDFIEEFRSFEEMIRYIDTQ